MNNKFKRYEWVIYFLMVIVTLMMIALSITLLLNKTWQVGYINTYTAETLKSENVIKILKVVIMISIPITWILIEGLLVHLLKIIKSLIKNGVFVEENKKSVKRMSKYLIAFGVIYLLFTSNMYFNTSRTDTMIREIGDGIGLLTLNIRYIEFTIYTVILIIIYIIIRVISLVFREELEIKEINNEIV
ncbi:DUF2975 domain-containing protein [Clostridium gasigenes]|uniref:DUF2975 domain-containing protein n=1 Tax=Clostridium gasigenes TaxID=94869 RepID=UPI001C0B7CE6|nr:DUF2975 domain-containing protein [Clostridium gasigenes]MBU3137092.1 DUF2975 domain-containing protein [Clostridium gasigenes]